MTSDPPSLGARIRRARNLKRLSQQQLAAAVGASVRAVGNWERDQSVPRNLAVVEEFLGVSLNGTPLMEIYTDPLEEAIWAEKSLPPDVRRDLSQQIRQARTPPVPTTERPPAQQA